MPPMPPQAPLPPMPAVVIPQPPKRYRLLEDHRSYFKRSDIYGRKHDVVTEISVSDPVVIVEAEDGSRYPIHKSKLTQI